MFGPIPPELPPLREVNHDIPLIDEKLVYNYRLPKCPDTMRAQLLEKVARYTAAGWWIPKAVSQAAPMLCIAKKNGKLRSVVDCRQRNDNTIKDVTPFPDQDMIRNEVARAPFRSKIDLSDAYEQIRNNPDHVERTAFATIIGTFVSQVMQQGDCNAPSTFQRLMTHIFRDTIGRSNHPYLDDNFITTFTDADRHDHDIRRTLDIYREQKLHLSIDKCDFFSSRMDCLGHIIDDQGIHADMDKMRKIRDWPEPVSYHDIQRFLGLVNYVAQFLPEVVNFTGPLSGCTRNGRPFEWTPLLDKCFQSIKVLACKAPILKPIDPDLNEPIWVICDASSSGIGAVYGQGSNWNTCRPAGFLSRKFKPAQRNYATYEQETIAIMEALLQWEDKLLGRRFTVVTDHKALEFFKTQDHLSNRQVRWWEYLSRFDFDIQYIQGSLNVVADALSRYHENDNLVDENLGDQDFVDADKRLDIDGDNLPSNTFKPISGLTPIDVRIAAGRRTSRTPPQPAEQDISDDEDVEAATAVGDGGNLRTRVEHAVDLPKILREQYDKDPLYRKILADPTATAGYAVRDGLVWTKNHYRRDTVCVPREAFLRGRRLIEVIIDDAHSAVGHFGQLKTSNYIRRYYWWSGMTTDIAAFCDSCGRCQMTKPTMQRPMGLLHSLPIPRKPWESVGMDFVGPLPQSKGNDYLLVVIDRLTSMIHLVPTTTKVTAKEVAWLYLKEVVRLHGVPDSIVSDRDARFTSKFWKELHRLMGTKLLMSTAFHPQTDGATERANRSVTQILRALVNSDQTDWAEKCPMVEYAVNASVSATTGLSPFELNYGYAPRISKHVETNTQYKGVREFAQMARWNLIAAHDAILESRVNQAFYANTRRREEPTYKVGDSVYLSTQNLNLPKGRVQKLTPRYIGPYRVTRVNLESSNVTLELPPELEGRRIHPTFHTNLVRPHHPNDEELFPKREAKAYYDFGNDDEQEWLVEEILDHAWRGRQLELQVLWTLGDKTWEPLQNCKDLVALDDYLELQGVRRPGDLPKKGSNRTG